MKRYIRSNNTTGLPDADARIQRECLDANTSEDRLVELIRNYRLGWYLVPSNPRFNTRLLSICVDVMFKKKSIGELMSLPYEVSKNHPELESDALAQVKQRLLQCSKSELSEGKKYIQRYRPYYMKTLKSILPKSNRKNTAQTYSVEDIADSISGVAPEIADEMLDGHNADYMMSKSEFIDYLNYQIETYPDELDGDDPEASSEWVDFIIDNSVFAEG